MVINEQNVERSGGNGVLFDDMKIENKFQLRKDYESYSMNHNDTMFRTPFGASSGSLVVSVSFIKHDFFHSSTSTESLLRSSSCSLHICNSMLSISMIHYRRYDDL